MTKKQVRIDVEDNDGVKTKISIEGNVTRDKVLKIFELMEMINIEEHDNGPKIDSVGGKIWYLVDKYYPTGKFTSSEILERYEDEYNEPVKLSIISTYLSRFTSKNKVQRAKRGRAWAYQAIISPNSHSQAQK